ncbi:MAG: M15 family metallopeptidase, partial [Nitriliruptoraceae bacterium]
LEEVVGDDPPVRVRGSGDTPVLRHADAVTAPARRKAAFGEFALRDAPGRDIEQEGAWIDEQVASASLPLLGEVTCHREALEALRGAMEALQRRGADELVSPGDLAGCWVPRLQTTDGPLSAHAWGIAIDLDPERLAQGSDAAPPAELVEVMAEHGFTNGDDWLLPDPMHFELVPDREPG